MRLAIILTLLLLAACDVTDARQALERQGFTRIQVTGYRPGHCLSGESGQGFSAHNAQGFHVSGVVCLGGARGPTVIVLEE